MPTPLINLLPHERTQQLRHLYFMRLGIVGILLLSAVGIIMTVLLIPSYLYLHQAVSERTMELDRLTTKLSGTEESQVNTRLQALKQDTARLTRLASQPSGTTAIAALLNVSRPGISISGITYTAPTGSTGARVTLSGASSTRESLRSYVLALSKLPYVKNVDLPIGAYAQETNIDFNLNLSGTFIPPTP